MAVTLLKSSFSSGELSPSVWGRVTAQPVQQGCSVMRNCFVSHRMSVSSRAGTLFVGMSPTLAGPGTIPPVLVRFQFNVFQSYVLEFGQKASGQTYMRVIANGGYVIEPPVAISVVTANPLTISAPGANYVVGDSVFVSPLGQTFVVSLASGTTYTLTDSFGRSFNATGLDNLATAARIYENHDVPYRIQDLDWLKTVQSADVMTLCCVNQETGTEYPPADLSRLDVTNWQYKVTDFAAAIAAPASITAVPNTTVPQANTGNGYVPAAQYAYVVTAVNANGEESIASPVAYTPLDNAHASVDIALTAGAINISWSAINGALQYNVYRAPASVWNTGASLNQPGTPVPIGSSFGFIGSATGTQFMDNNIVPDYTTTPPLHYNPFARGQIETVFPAAPGSGYTQANTTASVNSATGSGAVILPVVNTDGTISGYIVQNSGGGYLPGDTLVITGDGTGAQATLNIGPQSGTWPMVPGYFQSRRVYGATLNRPDTLFFSQTGVYTNMDSAQPPIDSDAIVMTPWAQQINTVQWLVQMTAGLLVCTGLDCWQVSGQGGGVLTPASEQASVQETNGFSPTVPPIKVFYNVLFVQEQGYTVRDLQFNFYVDVYAGTDLSVLSSHLFAGYTIKAWSWSKIPWRTVWACRDDGKLLSLTYDKELQLAGWARHDTNGLFMRTAVATEPPVDSPYFVVQRFVPGANQWAYYIERMDNHLWDNVEDTWCIDCGLELPQGTPAATLSASAANGPGVITGGYLATSGQRYRNPSATAEDPTGNGSGFEMRLTVENGEIIGFTIVNGGAHYSPATQVRIHDPQGSGATFVPFVSQNVLFTANADVFGPDNVGDVIRIGGGHAEVTAVISGTEVEAKVTVPIVKTMPNDPNNIPVPAAAGDWTITTPVTQVTGLDHLEGMTVTGLADGTVIPQQKVLNGSVSLPAPATSIKVGLPFIAQLQALHLEEQSQGSIQGKRKQMSGITVRMEQSRGIQVGANRPVASALDNQEEIPWTNMVDLPDLPRANIPDAALPLFSGDKFVLIDDDWHSYDGWQASPAMVAAQQTLPLPMSVTALVANLQVGDGPD